MVFMKQIIKNFNKLIKKTIFKVQNKTNNNFRISNFNKYLITFILSLFTYLFYLLIPLLYDKNWVQDRIESKLLSEFKVAISTLTNISYRILPAPHFLIQDSKILEDAGKNKKSIAEIKDFKIFLSQKNFFNREKMNIKKIVIDNANFSLLRSDLKSLNKMASKKFSNKKATIKNSNIFFRDNLGEIISIIKIDKSILFFDDKKLLNFLNLKGEIFNTPFTFDFINSDSPKKYQEINFYAKPLRLVVSNKSTAGKEFTSGINSISFLRSVINTKYDIKEKLVTFKSNNSRLDNSKINYTGKLLINPFDLNFNIYLDDYKVSELYNINPILLEFIKSRLLFNDNISVKTSIFVNSNIKNEIFNKAKINFQIINGKINFDKTKFVNDKIGSLQFDKSNLFYKDNDLIFNTNMKVEIRNSANLFSILNTNKMSRKNFQTILINLDYNFSSNKIKFTNLRIDNKDTDNEFLTILDQFNDNNWDNLNSSRRLLNSLLKAYAG